MAQTALQELIEWMKNTPLYFPHELDDKITELLPKERKDIIDARIDGIKKALTMQNVSPESSEKYFTQTFNH